MIGDKIKSCSPRNHVCDVYEYIDTIQKRNCTEIRLSICFDLIFNVRVLQKKKLLSELNIEYLRSFEVD